MLIAYVGSYAPRGGGIHGFVFEPGEPPALAGTAWVPDGDSPSWLCCNAGGTRLYAVHELHRASGSGEGCISSYEIAPSGHLRRLRCVPSGGVRPVHLSLHPGGRHAFVAHYDSADLAVLALDDEGCVGPVLQRCRAADAVPGAQPGPAHAVAAPQGSFAGSGHDAAHAHCALPDPSGHHVLCTDLGLDLLVAWRFDAARGRLEAPQAVAMTPGAGPRHIVFHPHLHTRLYLLNEEASTLAWLRLHDGRLERLGETSTLGPGYVGTSYASDLCVSADGRHLYALNRLLDSIAHFALAADGTPRLQGIEWCRGSYPRTLRLVPGGGLVVCNERSDHLAWFRIAADGAPRFSGRCTGVGGAASIVFVPA